MAGPGSQGNSHLHRARSFPDLRDRRVLGGRVNSAARRRGRIPPTSHPSGVNLWKTSVSSCGISPVSTVPHSTWSRSASPPRRTRPRSVTSSPRVVLFVAANVQEELLVEAAQVLWNVYDGANGPELVTAGERVRAVGLALTRVRGEREKALVRFHEACAVLRHNGTLIEPVSKPATPQGGLR